MNKIRLFLLINFVALVFAACRENQWDEQGKQTIEGVNTDLIEAIRNTPEISKFYEALVKTGYDKLLTTGNNFTVLAPTNDAWNSEDAGEGEKLERTVANHIGYEKRISTDRKLYEELMLVSGKVLRYGEFDGFGMNAAQISSPDHATGNGVFHIVDNTVKLQSNIWEHVIYDLVDEYAQARFMRYDLADSVIDITRSIKIGVHPQTGAPLYDTAWMKVNWFLEDAAPLNDEMKYFNYIVLADDGFEYLHNKFRPYYRRKTDKGTDSLARFSICRDLVFDSSIDILAAIASHATVTNIDGYNIELSGDLTGEPFIATNGRVYVLSRTNVRLREKIKPVYIDGAEYTSTNAWSAANSNRLHNELSFSWATGPYSYTDASGTTYNYTGTGRSLIFRMHYGRRDTIREINGEPMRCKWLDVDSTDVFEISWGSIEGNYFPAESRKYNAYVEYKAPIFSGDYEIRYRSFIPNESLPNVTIGGSLCRQSLNRKDAISNPDDHPCIFRQKLFVSMPDAPRLRHGNGGSRPPAAYTRPADIASHPDQRQVWSVNAIENNFMGPDTAFVSVDTAFVDRERVMSKWRLKFTDKYQPGNQEYDPATIITRYNLCQYIQHPIKEPDAQILRVPRKGELTLWLANTVSDDRNDASSDYGTRARGPLALDYFLLVPILPDED